VAADPDLALRIKRARERAGLKQWQLAERVGVNRKTVDNWENARTAPKSSMGALEAVLGSLGGGEPDPREEELRVLSAGLVAEGLLDPAVAEQMIRRYRRKRDQPPETRAG
jgi:DNA-binding XRE family transcriptional regulator